MTISNEVWIRPNSTILNGLHIGSSAFVGAGSNILKDIAGGCKVTGVPARITK